jgi:O-antigen/teichoic acid export membrane protein
MGALIEAPIIPTDSITQRALGSIKWSALTELVSRTAQPAVFLILVRLLTPADFGLVAVATIPISLAQIFWDAGLSKALVQTRAPSAEAANVVFWTNLGLALAVYLLLFTLSPGLADFFKNPASLPILRWQGLQILLAAFGSVHQGLLTRGFEFRALFWIRLSSVCVPGLLSIPMALRGHGAWALVAGSLTGQAMNLVLLWRQSAWRPAWRYDCQLARRLLGFGCWVFLEGIGTWLLGWGDSIMVGRFLGTTQLGVYRAGLMLVTLLFGLALNPILPVVYPTFSRLQDDPSALQQAYRTVNRITIALAWPMGIGLLLLGPDLASVLFGERWPGLGFVLQVLGSKEALSWTTCINSEVYRAVGRPDLNSKLLLLFCLFYLPAYYVAARFDLRTFTLARFAISVPTLPIHSLVLGSLLALPPAYLWRQGKAAVCACGFLALVVAGLKCLGFRSHPGHRDPFVLGLLAMAAAMAYLGSLCLLDRELILKTKGCIETSFSSKRQNKNI